MAKKRATRKTTAKKKEAPVKGEIIDPSAQPAPPMGIQLMAAADVKVSANDVVAIAASRFEKRCRKEVGEGTKRIKKLDTLIKELRRDLQNALNRFMNGDFTHDMVTTGRAFFEARGLPFHYEKELVADDDKMEKENKFGVRFKLFSKKQKRTSYYSRQEVEYDYSDLVEQVIPVDLGEVDDGEQLVRQLKEAIDNRRQTAEVQRQWQQRISQVMAVERDARAKLAETMLEQSEEGRTLRDAILDQFEESHFDDMAGYDTVPALSFEEKK